MKRLNATIHISTLQSLKKICGLINKHREKILYFIISSFILLCMLFRAGILTPSKSFYVWYFNTFKNDFERVVKYFDDTNIPCDIYWNDLYDLHNINDVSVKQSIFKILYLGDFGFVSGGYKSSPIIFSANYIFDRFGKPIAIVYDSTHNNEEWSEDYWAKNDEYIKYSYTYEPLGDDWYYEYRSK